MRILVLLIALSAMPALAADAPPPPPPPPPPSSDPAPGADAQPPPSPADPPPTVEAKPKTNWAKPAAFIGFGVAAGVLTLSIIATAIGSGIYSSGGELYFGAGSYLMLPALALTAAAGPIVFFGGKSARWTKSITGSTALRITGWITYGVGLFVQFISIFAGGYTPLIGGIVGAGGVVCLGLDALFSANEAEDVGSMASREEDDSLFQFKPTVSLLLPGFAGSSGGTGAVVGIAGTF